MRISPHYVVRPFQTVHVIPSQGYMVCSQKNKLKAEFIGKPKSEIIAAKAMGQSVSDTVEVHLCSFETGCRSSRTNLQEGLVWMEMLQ